MSSSVSEEIILWKRERHFTLDNVARQWICDEQQSTTYSFSLSISVARTIVGLSYESHVLLMRASLLIYSHEFTCIHNFQRFLFRSFILAHCTQFGCSITIVEQNGWLHMCLSMHVNMGQRRKDKQVENEQNKRKKN